MLITVREDFFLKKPILGKNSHYQYDDKDYLIRRTVKAANNLWKQTVFERDRYGRSVRETDSLGRVTEYGYHNEGNYLL